MKAVAAALAVALCLTACETDTYDSGTGAFSLTRADFVEVYTDNSCAAVYAVTDDGDRLQITSPLTADWMAKADTTYRAIFYYNLLDGNRAAPVSISPVPVLVAHPAEDFEDGVYTDPVRLESVWVSSNGYLNIGMYLKTGSIGEDAELQTIGMIAEGTDDNPDGTSTARLRLYHSQGDVPEYYSSRYYISLPCTSVKADSVALTVNTYDGEVVRRLRIAQGE